MLAIFRAGDQDTVNGLIETMRQNTTSELDSETVTAIQRYTDRVCSNSARIADEVEVVAQMMDRDRATRSSSDRS